ncbi:hypothetical protein [Pseudooceanicola marinus]|uniref:hypothetical protein n=1 Tax=Pseudooceanicola marinus TaxID=396013 RepID=UPI001CD6E4EA|nr:hypothetical protein [Pseudooceanicola marinus]MCA1337354.1 hypothetical protein [Pseudooceanicola marinus]
MPVLIGTTRAAEIAALGRAGAPVISWDSLCTPDNLATGLGAEVVGQEAANAGTGADWDVWGAEADAGGVVTLDMSLAAPASADFAAISSHNLGELGATATLQVSLDGGSTWADTEAGGHVCTDGAPVIWMFHAVSAADWRLRISGLSEGDLVELAVLHVGGSLVLPRRIYRDYAPPLTPTNVQLRTNVSEGNKLLGSAVERSGSSVAVEVKLLREDEARSAAWTDFQRHYNSGAGFFWVPQPGLEDDAFFAWRGGNPLAPRRAGVRDFMVATLNLRLGHDW